MPQTTIGGEEHGSGLGGVIKDKSLPVSTTVILGTLSLAGYGYVPADTTVILGTLVVSTTTAKAPSDTTVIKGTLVTSVGQYTGNAAIVDTTVLLGQLRCTDNPKIIKTWTPKSTPTAQLGSSAK